MYRTLLLFFFTLIPFQANGFENLEPGDYFRSWLAERPISEGEIMELIVSSEGSAKLTRDLKDFPDMSFETTSLTIIDDLHFFIFRSKDGITTCKLVLSGLKSNHGSKKLFGSLFLYREGLLFNGVPVSFIPK